MEWGTQKTNGEEATRRYELAFLPHTDDGSSEPLF